MKYRIRFTHREGTRVRYGVQKTWWWLPFWIEVEEFRYKESALDYIKEEIEDAKRKEEQKKKKKTVVCVPVHPGALSYSGRRFIFSDLDLPRSNCEPSIPINTTPDASNGTITTSDVPRGLTAAAPVQFYSGLRAQLQGTIYETNQSST